jgi:hypothetical protein
MRHRQDASADGLCVATCRQKHRVRFTTAPGLVNELVEAKHQLQLRHVIARWSRYDLVAIDEVSYVPLAEVGAEFLFRVVAERAERAAVVLTTDLPFSEWTQVIQTRDAAKRCWIESPMLTSRKRARDPIASAALRTSSGHDGPWRAWKPTPGFPPFPPPLEIAPRFPCSHGFDDDSYNEEAKTASPQNQQLRVGQINCRNEPSALVKPKSERTAPRRFLGSICPLRPPGPGTSPQPFTNWVAEVSICRSVPISPAILPTL